MRLNQLLGITILLLGFSILAASATTDFEQVFNNTYGGEMSEFPSSAVETNDGGYIIVGATNTYGAGDYDIWVIKIDKTGNIMWNKTYGSQAYESSHYVIKADTNQYLITGRKRTTAGDMDLLLLLIDDEGDQLWNKSYGGPGDEWMWEIEKTQGGDFVLGGRTNSYGAGGNDYWLMKIDAEGDVQWNKTLGGEADDRARSLEMAEDGGFLLNGWSSSYSKGMIDFWLIKTDNYGDPMWNKSYGTSEGDRGIALTKSLDGGYLLGGNTNKKTMGATDFLLIKTNAQGTQLWNRTYGGEGEETIHYLLTNTDDQIIMFGYTESFGAGDRDLYLIIANNSGTVLWNNTYGGPMSEGSSLCIQTNEGGYLIGGETTSYGNGESDFYIIKLKPVVDEQENKNNTSIPGFSVISILIGLLVVVRAHQRH